MVTFYTTGVHRIWYKASKFATGKTITAYFWSPSLVKSSLQIFTEAELGFYYLDYDFEELGDYPCITYENDVIEGFGVYRVQQSVSTLYESGAGGTCPVDLTEMKLHLKVTIDTEDDLIAQLMLAATSWAEEFQRRTYITRSRTYYLDSFPSIIRPPYSPLVSAVIQYVDTNGDLQTLDAAEYRVDTDSEPGRITEAYNCSWPDTRSITNAVTITYNSGYGEASDVPEEIKAAIKLFVGHLYEHREAVSEIKLEEVPMAVKSLLWTRKIIN